MSVAKFEKLLPLLSVGKADRAYFLKWIQRYAGWVVEKNLGRRAEDLPVSTEQVIAFCRHLLASKTPAWQRLQSVCAIESYRDSVLQTQSPCLKEITGTLKQLAAKAVSYTHLTLPTICSV